MKNKFFRSLFFALLTLTSQCFAATLSPFFISYDVVVYGEPGSVAYLRLEQKSTDQFVLQGVGEMALTLEGIRKSKTMLTQQHSLSSEVFLDNGLIHPSRFEHRSKGVGPFLHQTHAFDWIKREVRTTKGKKCWNAPITNNTYDPLSLYLALKRALPEGNNLIFTLPRKDELKTYTFVKKGQKKLKTALGELDTIQVVLSEKSGERVTTLWFAPKFDFHLIKAIYQEEGTTIVEATIRSFTHQPETATLPKARPMTPSPKRLGQLLGELFKIKR